ncbi:MAG: fibronectin type III domain-containing protein [Planctomycetes bacterium]|nr:fibronectin type III domain-containing protein [Planctomycetota bacterium]
MYATQWKMIVAVAAVACSLRLASAEKVFFRDELTGCEIWRLSKCQTFHEYSQAAKPFSYEGRWVVCRWRENAGIVVFDLKTGKEIVIGRNHAGAKVFPAFVRGHNAVVYSAGSTDVGVYLYDLDTSRERKIVQLQGNVLLNFAGVIGPRSDYLMLRGDMDGDGFLDWGLKSLWTDESPRVLWSSPIADGWCGYVTPSVASNRVTLNVQSCSTEMIRRVNRGEKLGLGDRRLDAKRAVYIADFDVKTRTMKKYPFLGAKSLGHVTWSGDGQYMHNFGYSWRAAANRPLMPIRIGEAPSSNHYGTCGHSGRYVVGDTLKDQMAQLELTDLWTGERRTVANISATTDPPGAIAQDHGHPAGSPDGTKVMFHSCYDLVNHRLYAIPSRDVHAGDAVIPVETTEGFAPKGKLLIGYGQNGKARLSVSYERKDETGFHDCDWGGDAAARLRQAVRADIIEKGSRQITDAWGRLFPNGQRRPRKDYIAVVRQPGSPRAVVATLVPGKGVRLTWLPPASHREIAGYVAYRRPEGGVLKRLNAEPVAGCEYIDPRPKPNRKLEYVVRAVEYSGLFSACSSVAWVHESNTGARVVDSYDVRGCTFIEPGERPTIDRRSIRIRVPTDGEYRLWGRGRAWQDAETLHVFVDGKRLPDAQVTGTHWHWVELSACTLTAGEHVVELVRQETHDIRERNLLENPSFEAGLEGWSLSDDLKANGSLDRSHPRTGRQCARFAGDLSSQRFCHKAPLRVKPEWCYRLSFWMRVRFTEGFRSYPCSLGEIVQSVLPSPRDAMDVPQGATQWDETKWHHIELIHTTGPRPDGEPIESLGVWPQWTPSSWGGRVAMLWVDDVSFTEIGPRLRPVKVTKLLVTSLPDYRPKGLDGREAYSVPPAPVCSVSGLCQTGRIRNGMTLGWKPSCLGTRGYSLYVNEGGECPTTKYFLKTTVWGKTSVTLRGLARAADYSIKITAINEDGTEGPPATIRAATAILPPEEHVLEAEQGEITAPMVVRQSDGVTFLVTPADPDRIDELDDPHNVGRQTGTVRFDFTIREGGEYLICGRTFAPHGGSNSFWFSTDGQPETLWNVPNALLGKWSWIAPVNGKFWHLEPGPHTIAVRTREAGTRLDRLVVTNDIDNARFRVK